MIPEELNAFVDTQKHDSMDYIKISFQNFMKVVLYDRSVLSRRPNTNLQLAIKCMFWSLDKTWSFYQTFQKVNKIHNL